MSSSLVSLLVVGLAAMANAQRDLTVDLGVAGNFAILAAAGVSSVPDCSVTGDIGVSPAALSYITGFSTSFGSSTAVAQSPYVNGAIYAADMSNPTPAYLTAAVSNMETAYVQANGFVNPDEIELNDGDLSGLTLAPGLYKWSSNVILPTDLVFNGTAEDTWVLQVAGTVRMASDTKITLTSGANATNIVWAVADAVTFGDRSHFEGIVLAATGVTLQTEASMFGRILAQTEVALQKATVVAPFDPEPEVVTKRSVVRWL
uniref:Antifreeze protein n=1 Tax=Glaciozyma antarctica TaxID=105987 RepID=M1K078_9BASI|nr:antifreeze protein [Glaciozyma antarctica]